MTNISMAVVTNITALFFLTFRELYGISYSLLGLLVLVNFCTQLAVDLLFSFFSHKINVHTAVRAIPILTSVGFLLFATAPVIFPNAVYIGLLLGTVIFAASGGFSEVLISPIIEALPSDNPERELSALHSVYAWGTVGVIIVSSLFILLFGAENWQLLILGFIAIPAVSAVLYMSSALPSIEAPERTESSGSVLKNPSLWLCVLAIFLGGASECVMAQWSSSYLENALSIPKFWGDIFGVALFALMLGLGRTLYAKYGKSVEKIMLLGAIGASCCYLIAAMSSFAPIGLVACALTGFCVSMLWPGSLIVGADRVVSGGVVMYAMLAAGGDLGASVGTQLVGLVVDAVAANLEAVSLACQIGITPEQLGLKVGMLVGALFPIAAILVYTHIVRTKSKKDEIS